MTIPGKKPGRYVVSALDLINAVAKEEKSLDVTHIGEANIVVTYRERPSGEKWKEYIKTGLVCILSFFGAAFSIMTFNTDVDIQGLGRRELLYWSFFILWESESEWCFSLIISDMENQPKILRL